MLTVSRQTTIKFTMVVLLFQIVIIIKTVVDYHALEELKLNSKFIKYTVQHVNNRLPDTDSQAQHAYLQHACPGSGPGYGPTQFILMMEE